MDTHIIIDDDYISSIETAKSKLLCSLSVGSRNSTPSCEVSEGHQCAWSLDGCHLAWSCGRGRVKVIPWNKAKNCLLTDDDRDLDGCSLSQPRLIRTFEAGESIFSVAFGQKSGDVQRKNSQIQTSWNRYKSASDLILAVGLRGGRIRTWNVRTGKVFLVLMDHTGDITDLSFSPDGALCLLSASRDGTLKLWHLNDDGNMSHTFRSQESKPMRCGAWSPDCSTVCGVGDLRTVSLWNIETRKVRLLRGHVNNVCGCAFSPDGALLATASYDTSVIIWEPQSGNILHKLHHLNPPPKEWMVGGANASYIRHLSFSRNGRHICTVCDDGFFRFWDLLKPASPQAKIDAPDCLGCAFSPNGSAAAVGFRDGTLRVWSCPNHELNLKHMCRIVIQRRLLLADTADKENILNAIPPCLRVFTNYHNLQADQDYLDK